jgi:hypothetical protein
MLPPTGNPVEYTGLSMCRIKGGRSAGMRETRHTLGITHQLDPSAGGGHHG